MSFWLKNEGIGTYSKNPKTGRDSTHLIKVEETFALWFDSQTTLRAYVYADANHFEYFSDPIFLPVDQWINLQIQLDDENGVTMMTFNQQKQKL